MKAKADSNSFGAKLQYLLDHVPDPDTGELMSIPQLAKRIVERGFKLHANTIRSLLTGTKNNPTWQVVEGIATAFGVSTDLFRSDVTLDQWKRQQLQRHLLNHWEARAAKGDDSPAPRSSPDKRLGVVAGQGTIMPEGLDLATDVATTVLEYFTQPATDSRRRTSDHRTSRSAWSDSAANASADLEDTSVQQAVAP